VPALREHWPAAADLDTALGRFIDLLAEASEVTLGPRQLGVINWLVASARDADPFA
jgi:hypothetical protein